MAAWRFRVALPMSGEIRVANGRPEISSGRRRTNVAESTRSHRGRPLRRSVRRRSRCEELRELREDGVDGRLRQAPSARAVRGLRSAAGRWRPRRPCRETGTALPMSASPTPISAPARGASPLGSAALRSPSVATERSCAAAGAFPRCGAQRGFHSARVSCNAAFGDGSRCGRAREAGMVVGHGGGVLRVRRRHARCARWVIRCRNSASGGERRVGPRESGGAPRIRCAASRSTARRRERGAPDGQHRHRGQQRVPRWSTAADSHDSISCGVRRTRTFSCVGIKRCRGAAEARPEILRERQRHVRRQQRRSTRPSRSHHCSR